MAGDTLGTLIVELGADYGDLVKKTQGAVRVLEEYGEAVAGINGAMDSVAGGSGKAASAMEKVSRRAEEAKKAYREASKSAESFAEAQKDVGGSGAGGSVGMLDKIDRKYKELQQTLERGLELGTVEGAERIRKEIQFIESALEDVAGAHDVRVDSEGVVALQNRLEHLQTELAETTAQADRMGDMITNTGRRGGQFNQIVFSSGEALQDAQYGIRGAANNLAFMAEQFANVASQGQGFKAILKGLAGSLLGAGGIILAVQALLVFGPKIVSFFKDLISGATDAEKALKEAADAVQAVKTGVEALPFEGVEIPIAIEMTEMKLGNLQPEREQVAAEIEAAQNRLAALRGRMITGVDPIKRAQMMKRVAQMTQEQRAQQIAATQEVIAGQRDYLDQIDLEIKRLSELQTELDKGNEKRKAQLEINRRNAAMGAGLSDVWDDVQQSAEDAAEAMQSIYADLRTELKSADLNVFVGQMTIPDKLRQNVESYRDAWKAMAIETGRNSKATQDLWQQYQKAFDVLKSFESLGVPPAATSAPTRVPLQDTEIDWSLEEGQQAAQKFDEMELQLHRIGDQFKATLGQAISSAASQFGQDFLSILQGPDEMVIASLEGRKLSLKEQLTSLQQSLAQGEVAHDTYAARVKAIHAELAETQRQLAFETANVFEKTFRSIGNLVTNIMKQVMAELAAAIARAAVLFAINAATGGAGTFLGFLSGKHGVGTALAPMFSRAAMPDPSRMVPSAPAMPRMAPARMNGQLRVVIEGESTTRGSEIVTVYQGAKEHHYLAGGD